MKTLFIVYRVDHDRLTGYGEWECWGFDPMIVLAGITSPSEGWLMIPPDGWECL